MAAPLPQTGAEGETVAKKARAIVAIRSPVGERKKVGRSSAIACLLVSRALDRPADYSYRAR